MHLCIYLIDPSSIQSAAQRNQLRPTRPGTALRSETPEASQEGWDSDSSDEEDGAANESRALTMLPAEVRAIQRLSRRTNVLPVLAHGDTLTDARLARVKRAVRRDLANAGVDLRLFGVGDDQDQPQRGRVESRVERKDEDEPKVIKTRFRRPSRPRAGTEQNTEAPVSPVEGVHIVPKIDEMALANMFPFVVIAPDVPKIKSKNRKHTQDSFQVQGDGNVASRSSSVPGTPMAITTDDPDLTNAELTGEGASADINEAASDANLAPPAPNPPSRSPSTYASPGVLPPTSWRGGNQSVAGTTGGGVGSLRTLPRGQFTRKYRWGTIDVLDPAHCDVGVLRGVILGSHMKVRLTGITTGSGHSNECESRPSRRTRVKCSTSGLGPRNFLRAGRRRISRLSSVVGL